MWTGREYVMYFPPDRNGEYDFIFLDGAAYGKACFSGWTVKGTIGCSLSHLSVIKDGYDSGHETIWILEDDIEVLDDPHKLSGLIDELDELVGKGNWDVLYTDYDYLVVDLTRDLTPQIPMMWRPDMPYFNPFRLAQHCDLSDRFMKIGSRSRAHSIIYRRSGMEKILRFYREHNNFLPYDQEMAMIPDLQMYVVKEPVVSVRETNSDTRYRHFPK